MKFGVSRVLGVAPCFCLLIGTLVPGEERRPPTPADIVDLRALSEIQVSPNGKLVAFVVAEPADPHTPRKPPDTNIWVVPSDGSLPARLFAASPKSDTHPRWSPDGRYLAFLSDRGKPVGQQNEAHTQIWLMKTEGGEAEQLTKLDGAIQDLKWSRDGRMIAFTVLDPETLTERGRATRAMTSTL